MKEDVTDLELKNGVFVPASKSSKARRVRALPKPDRVSSTIAARPRLNDPTQQLAEDWEKIIKKSIRTILGGLFR